MMWLGWAASCQSPLRQQRFADSGLATDTATAIGETPSLWHYGAYLDVGYVVNFNFPENHLWRNRATASRHNDSRRIWPWRMSGRMWRSLRVGAWNSASKEATTLSTLHFAGEREVGGADTLRHIHRANVSYLAPDREGLTITAGLFNSLIGYESLYAKDNVNYTRSWIADNTPLHDVRHQCKISGHRHADAHGFIVNGYYHLSHPNDQPSYGGQWAYKATPHLTLTQTVYGGPDQTNTALEFWRFGANHIVEWKGEDPTLAASYDIGTEAVADRPGHPRAFVMGGNVVARWHVTGPWALAVRPEFYWDRNGRWTGSEQFVKAVTSTVEYRIPYKWTNTTLRLEHRWDESTGAGGDFFVAARCNPACLA